MSDARQVSAEVVEKRAEAIRAEDAAMMAAIDDAETAINELHDEPCGHGCCHNGYGYAAAAVLAAAPHLRNPATMTDLGDWLDTVEGS